MSFKTFSIINKIFAPSNIFDIKSVNLTIDFMLLDLLTTCLFLDWLNSVPGVSLQKVYHVYQISNIF